MTTLPPSLARNDEKRVIADREIKSPAAGGAGSILDGAGNETRTRDPDLGKVVLYQLSYSRISSKQGRNCRSRPREVKANVRVAGNKKPVRSAT